MKYTVERLCNAISELKSGNRAWYAFLPEACGSDEPPLFLFPFSGEDVQEKLQQSLVYRSTDDLENLKVGTAVVSTDGILNLKGSEFSPLDLMSFSQWLNLNVDEKPMLSRLKYTSLQEVDTEGSVVRTLASRDLFDYIDDNPFPAGMFETGHRLQKMEPADPHWFWMSAKGPGNKPVMVLVSQKEDPDGESFSATVQRFNLRAGRILTGISGVVTLVGDGSLAFASFVQPAGWRDLINALLAEYQNRWIGFRRLARSQMHRVVDGRLKSGKKKTAPKREIKNQVKGLKKIVQNNTLHFWLTDDDGSGNPFLLLHPDPQKLKAEAKEIKAKGNKVNGKVRMASKGYIEFRSKNGFSNFVGTLALWVRSNLDKHPELAKFSGARFIQANDKKEILDRQKDSAAWKGI